MEGAKRHNPRRATASQQPQLLQLAPHVLGHGAHAGRRAVEVARRVLGLEIAPTLERTVGPRLDQHHLWHQHDAAAPDALLVDEGPEDRKSTRLNSSHMS